MISASRVRSRTPHERSFAFIALNGISILFIDALSVFPLLYVCYLSVVDIRAGEALGSFVGVESSPSRWSYSCWKVPAE